ncbi:MAG: ribose-phosphate pyrophosphokinase [Candidatus Omnitrophica bacterium]|nr:ribose-phosphate pyrophosphokinase [Candidatus Omnitrophota bacterium]
MKQKLGIFSGTSNPELSKNICEYLNISLGKVKITRFPDGETHVKIEEDVRGRDVFVVQSTSYPTNENLMELLIFIDTLRRASAWRITAVIPYFGYARQDRKDQPRVPITAKLVANLIATAGADRVLTMDLHASQVQGFFDIPLDHLFAINVFVNYFSKLGVKDLVVGCSDVGGVKMARAYSSKLGTSFAIVDKRRISGESVEVLNIMGDVRGKNVIIVDDMVTTAGSLVTAADALVKEGANEIYAFASHGVLADPALERLEKSVIKELVVTDSIPVPNTKRHPKLKILTIAPLLGEAIGRIHREESVSSLFS